MERDIYGWLKNWKDEKRRKPLIIRGARQVGKTWLVEDFGKRDFKLFVGINFEFQSQMKRCFSTLDPFEIVQKIELNANVDIIAGETLLFLDEIQDCPRALKALRYFYEKMPDLHVIAAGSLLEFVMDAEKISIPVGRVQNIYLGPLSFGEFLTARGERKVRSYLKTIRIKKSISESIHEKCVSILRDYLYLGGMPEAIDAWLESRKFSKTDESHQALLQNYRHDFGKYGGRVNVNLLEKTFSSAPGLVGAKFKYARVDRQINSRDVKKALGLLIKAHVIHKIIAASGSGLPLRAHCNEKFFKILFLDVGLLQGSMGISGESYLSDNLLAVYKGLVAEQFVGQQLLALKKPYEEPELFYWRREARSGAAEIDYLWQSGERILPVEVKAGKTGALKSLRLFLSEKEAPFGVRFSLHPLSFTDSVLSIPLYCVEATPRLIDQALAPNEE
ncbi:MAG: ATP-binding protein [Desulfobacterales bacterium]|nr:ATP-binding protein [Desulfobacterales bacterium]